MGHFAPNRSPEAAHLLVPKRCSIPICAILSISGSVSPRPRGGAAMSMAYSATRELRNGSVSSVYGIQMSIPFEERRITGAHLNTVEINNTGHSRKLR